MPQRDLTEQQVSRVNRLLAGPSGQLEDLGVEAARDLSRRFDEFFALGSRADPLNLARFDRVFAHVQPFADLHVFDLEGFTSTGRVGYLDLESEPGLSQMITPGISFTNRSSTPFRCWHWGTTGTVAAPQLDSAVLAAAYARLGATKGPDASKSVRQWLRRWWLSLGQFGAQWLAPRMTSETNIDTLEESSYLLSLFGQKAIGPIGAELVRLVCTEERRPAVALAKALALMPSEDVDRLPLAARDAVRQLGKDADEILREAMIDLATSQHVEWLRSIATEWAQVETAPDLREALLKYLDESIPGRP